MILLEKAERIRIYIGEDHKHKMHPLSDVILREAKELGLAGATVFRGMAGFGANSRIRTTKILRLSEDLPVIIEVVDHPDRLEKFLERLEKLVTDGMITREPIEVMAYRHSK
ncbi:DUF190 domain-containing protein [Pseudodesulfovibrio sediminis]|uniref:DUF190 domain-containing protein n=1 Tax=Pseudodesulfovibrio sediminis TaxID=2810563 RepID=A0ABM8HXP3_9BACT|nr:DUF190 domain-containing protein [Pseudodesulfovibrio sediminis]BCS86975.1 hypothetical protein PSDVSF_02170 [Pseudodesulfovibrio sediminis]